mmetsp:Transcript_56309/g.163313  ORF Transcript_56309/g.163313 Transcript_56309/m.163313 type:complete len:252 (-) Transcript_56309:261-1016(-)
MTSLRSMELCCTASMAVADSFGLRKLAVSSRFITFNLCISLVCWHSKSALLRMLWTETPRKPFSRYHGMAMPVWNTGSRSSGTWRRKSFISIPPCRSSVSRTRTMVFSYSNAHCNCCTHGAEVMMPSVMKKRKAWQFCTPVRIVSSIRPCVSSSMKNVSFGLTSLRNICKEMMVSCAFRCKCDKKMSHGSFLPSARFAMRTDKGKLLLPCKPLNPRELSLQNSPAPPPSARSPLGSGGGGTGWLPVKITFS